MMIYIDNFSHWLRYEWIDFMMTNTGIPGPAGKVPENNHELEQFENSKHTGYDLTATYWYNFFPSTLPFKIDPPVPAKNYDWTMVKQNPGNFMPMHVDQAAEIAVERYWMPLTDYTSGHVMIYADKLIKDYRAGDLFLFDDPRAFHGSCNIGFSPRISYNLNVYG
jgi:hypothetical protein